MAEMKQTRRIKVHGLVRPGRRPVLCGRTGVAVTTAQWADVDCEDCRRRIPGQHSWEALLSSLEAAKNPGHRDDIGHGNLTNAIVFAARCSATDHPRWESAQTVTTELVEEVGSLVRRSDVTHEDIVKTVDYVVDIAKLPRDLVA